MQGRNRKSIRLFHFISPFFLLLDGQNWWKLQRGAAAGPVFIISREHQDTRAIYIVCRISFFSGGRRDRWGDQELTINERKSVISYDREKGGKCRRAGVLTDGAIGRRVLIWGRKCKNFFLSSSVVVDRLSQAADRWNSLRSDNKSARTQLISVKETQRRTALSLLDAIIILWLSPPGAITTAPLFVFSFYLESSSSDRNSNDIDAHSDAVPALSLSLTMETTTQLCTKTTTQFKKRRESVIASGPTGGSFAPRLNCRSGGGGGVPPVSLSLYACT